MADWIKRFFGALPSVTLRFVFSRTRLYFNCGKFLTVIMASSKKKITQDELRRLMNEQKKKLLNNVKKIESPLARYDKDGTLNCIICETVVRSEAVWSVHLNSKNHKQNILNKVKKKEEPPRPVEPIAPIKFKRPAVTPAPVPPKKIKGILKNSTATTVSVPPPSCGLPSSKSKLICVGDDDDDVEDVNKNESVVEAKDDKTETEEIVPESLPEGFFDDPKLDAKVRNVEYKDPIEEEWEQFQKEIKEETSKAQQIIAEDQEEATTERQIDEIDEQIRNWSRVLSLEKKKEEVGATVTGQRAGNKEEENSGDEEEFEEFLDWRSKKSFDYNLKT